MRPFPTLPADSASSCSSQTPRPAMPGEAVTVTLSRPRRASTPRTAPSSTPGSAAGGTDAPPGAVEEVLHEDIGLERGSRLARDDEQRVRDVDSPLGRPDLSGVSRVEDEELGGARDPAEGHLQDFGAEARSSHAEHQRVS